MVQRLSDPPWPWIFDGCLTRPLASSFTHTGTSITQASSPVANNSSVTNSIMNGSSDNPSFYVLAILGDSLSDTGAALC